MAWQIKMHSALECLLEVAICFLKFFQDVNMDDNCIAVHRSHWNFFGFGGAGGFIIGRARFIIELAGKNKIKYVNITIVFIFVPILFSRGIGIWVELLLLFPVSSGSWNENININS